MTTRISLLTLAAWCVAANPARAGEPAAAPITIDPAASRWRVGAGYAPLLGLKTEFSGLGTFHSAFAPQPLGGGQNYNYDNGFVHVDSSGNAGGQTWNWSYANASQVQAAGAGSLDYSLTNSLANGRATENNTADAGVECFTYLDMGTVGIAALRQRGATWGFRGGLHYARVNAANSELIASGSSTLTDNFNLGGTIAPLAPYTGSFNGPGPLINDAPTSSVGTGSPALVAGSRELNVHLTTLNFGSYLAIPVTRDFDVLLEAGLSAAVAAGTYDFQSATSIAGLGTQTSSGHDSNTRVLPGAYLGLNGIYQINNAWAVQAAARYQYLNEYKLGANGSSAALSFNSAFVLSLGVVYSF